MTDRIQAKDTVLMTASTQKTEEVKVQGDTHPRYTEDAAGLKEWGSGSAAPDTNLYRSAADTLKTDDSLLVGGDLTVSGYVASSEVTTESTAASTLANTGISLLPSTGAVDYTLVAPFVGAVKHIMVTGGSTLIKSVTSNGATMGSTANNKASIDLIGASLHLVGVSTSLWAIVSKSTAVTMSTA